MAATLLSRARKYGVAFVVAVVVVLLRVVLEPWPGRSTPYLLFVPGIMLAARGGFGPGLLTTVLCATAALFRYTDPLRTQSPPTPGELISLILFLAVGALIARLGEAVRRAESAQAYLAAIVESSDDAIVGKDLNGIITSWNRGAERLFGYAAEEVIGRSITIIIPVERLSEEDRVLGEIRAGRRVEHFETTRRRKDGGFVDVSITVSPILNRPGTITGASKIARDITERRESERLREDLVERQRVAREEAVEARDRLAFLADVGALLSTSLDYSETLDRAVHLALPRLGDYCNVLVEDEAGRLRHVAWGHVDRTKEAALHALATSLLQASGTSHVPTFAERIMTGGGTLVVSHAQLTEALAAIAPDVATEFGGIGDQLRPHAYIGAPLLVRGRIIGVLSFGTTALESRREYVDADVILVQEFARRVSLAIENARLFRQADELNRLKDEFLATLSHELRTPLSAVIGWSRMLANGQLEPDRAAHAIGAIERNAMAQARIVDDVLDVARGMAGNLRLETAPLDLVEVVERSVGAIAPVAGDKQIRVDLRAPAPVPIVGDAVRLQQVVWNLMSNAVKFTPPGGLVTIDVGAEAGLARLRVTDTGIGIPPSFVPFVFDKFRQADGSFSRQYGGLGLGLAIARHLVELHGGSIEAQSAGEGLGATVVVRLPLTPAAV